MFKHADEILLAMPEWDLLKYYNLACSWALQSDFEKAKFALKMTFAIASEEEWKEMREMCRPYQERLNPDGLPSPNHMFPPTVRVLNFCLFSPAGHALHTGANIAIIGSQIYFLACFLLFRNGAF
jgi:hypothetical protein